MGKIRTTFLLETKLQAVKLYLEDERSYADIARELEISDKKIIRRWVANYQEAGEAGLEDKRGKAAGPRRGRPRKNPLSLEEEVKRLRAENEFLKKWLGLEKE